MSINKIGMKKRVLILFNKKDSEKSIGSKQYEDLYLYASEKGIEFCRASIDDYDLKNNFFREVQFFDGAKWFIEKNVKPDLVLDKSPYEIGEERKKIREYISAKYVFVNDLKISRVLSDKWETYKEFENFSPKTILIENDHDFENINLLKTEEIVLKPRSGSGGKDVKIIKKIDFSGNKLQFPFIAQEMVNAEKGIAGLVDGPHDLRIIFKNSTPFYAFLRIPPKGKLIANVSKGGKVKVVPINKIPENILDQARFISEKMSEFQSKFFSIDFIVDNEQKPWMLEMNSRPGLILEDEELEYKEYFYDNLLDFLLSI